MIESSFKDWATGVFSVVGVPGGPLTTDTCHWFRRDQPRPHHRYGEQDIVYNWNQHGFRSDEFIEDQPNILVVGCSFAVCLGVPTEHAWPWILRDRIDRDLAVYNLGLAASSSDYATRALHKTIDVLKPSAVAILWPAYTSREVAHRNRILPFKVAGTNADGNHELQRLAHTKDILLDHSYLMYQYEKNVAFAQSLCASRGVPVAHLPLVPTEFMKEDYAASVTGFDPGQKSFLFTGEDQGFEFARDGFHFGYEWNTWLSALFEEQLRSQGL